MLRSKAPVFVLGCGRSGTTLLYHMLLSSGNFAVYPTESNVFVLAPRFGNLKALKNKKKFLKVWLGSRLFQATGLNADEISAKILASCNNAGDFLRIVMEEIARNQGVERWADTTPEHILYLLDIKRTVPDALVVHIIRDGRDVALSWNKWDWLRPFPWDRNRRLLVTGVYWEWIVRKGREYGRRLGPDYTEVRFEDLVSQPRETLAKLGSFIDHDLDYDRILEIGIGAVKRPNSSFDQVSGDANFNPVGRWKDEFPSKELTAFEGLVGRFLEELEYPLANTNRALLERADLKAMNALYRLYFNSKLWAKKETPLARLLGNTDLSYLWQSPYRTEAPPTPK